VLVAMFTVTVPVPVEDKLLPSPLYCAVTGSDPTGGIEGVQVATPALNGTAEHRVVEPPRKVTVPVGVPLPVTVAVRVTD